MIDQGVSGIVVETPTEFRLLHFTQIQAALDQGIKSIVDVSGYVNLGFPTKKYLAFETSSSPSYWLKDTKPGMAMVCSGYAPAAGMFLASSAGYCCNANTIDPTLPLHYYPPQTRGHSNRCVVMLCPGTLP